MFCDKDHSINQDSIYGVCLKKNPESFGEGIACVYNASAFLEIRYCTESDGASAGFVISFISDDFLIFDRYSHPRLFAASRVVYSGKEWGMTFDTPQSEKRITLIMREFVKRELFADSINSVYELLEDAQEHNRFTIPQPSSATQSPPRESLMARLEISSGLISLKKDKICLSRLS